MILSLAALLALLLAGRAAAHGTLPGGTGFQMVALHPIVAIDHLLALLLAGVVLGRGARRGASVNADLRLALRDVDPDHRIYPTAKATGTTAILDRRVPPS